MRYIRNLFNNGSGLIRSFLLMTALGVIAALSI